jgi:hypothetical protein
MVAWIIRGCAPRPRGGTILERMVARKTVCLRRLGGNRGGELQAGRFFANSKVTAAKIVEGWSERTGAAVAGRHVLAIQACPCGGGGHHGGEIRHHRRAPPRPGSGEERQHIRGRGACHDRGGRGQPCLPGDGRRRCANPRRHRDRASPGPTVVGAGIAALDRNRRAGQAGVVIGSDGDCGGRSRERHVSGLGQRAATGLSSAEPGHACPCEGEGWTGGWCRRPVRRAPNRTPPSLAHCSAPPRISR